MLKNSNGETSNSSTTTDLNVDSGNVNGVLTEPENYRRTFSAKAGPKLKSGLDVENLIKTGATTFEVEGGGDDLTSFNLDIDSDDEETDPDFYLKQYTGMQSDQNKHDLIYKSISTEEATGDFEKLVSNFESITEDGKVTKMLVRKGTGKVIPSDGRVCIDYVAFIEGKSDAFDSTLERGTPQVIDFGTGSCLQGLEVGLKSMEFDEIAKFWVHYDYAFGEVGVPPRIPAAASVIFTVQLKQVFSGEELKSCLFMTKDERNNLPFEEICKAANELKEFGNGFYKSNSFWEAKRRYRTAIDLLESYATAKEREDQIRNEMVFALYSNLATCLLKLKRPAEACSVCKAALKLPISSASTRNEITHKVYFRFAEAKFDLCAFDEALKLAKKAENTAPRKVKEISEFIVKVEKELLNESKAMKDVYVKMFK